MGKKKNFFGKIFSVNDLSTHKEYSLGCIKLKLRSNITQFKKKYKNYPIQKNKILFNHHIGSYACNVKYITEEILRQNLPYDLVWVVNHNFDKYKDDFPTNVRIVKAGTSEEVEEYSTAKIKIASDRQEHYIKNGIIKRSKQYYIQTFHGSLGIKKTGDDREDANTKKHKYALMDAKQIDYLISNGTYTTNFFKRIFWNHGTILEVGHPRNDIFFKDCSHIKEKVCKKLNIPTDKKIVMYAPTLREDRDLTCYTLDYEKIIKVFKEKFGGEWILLTRLHPLITDLQYKFSKQLDCVIDATNYSDMQELLATCDALITDYSSCIYDFMLSRKPGFIFATDVKKYDNSRGLYYPLTSTPFPVAQNNDEMAENIKNFDNDKYLVEVDQFLKGKGCIDDGHASERVVELIKEIISKEK